MPGDILDPQLVSERAQQIVPGQQLYNKLPAPTVKAVGDYLGTYGANWKDPQAIQTLVNQTQLPADHLSKILQYANIIKQNQDYVTRQVNWHKDFSTLWDEFKRTGSDIYNHFVSNQPKSDSVTSPLGIAFNLPLQENKQTLKGQFEGAKNTAYSMEQTLAGAANRTIQTPLELLGIRNVNIPGVLQYSTPKGESSQTDAFTTMWNFYDGLQNAIDPIHPTDAANLAKGHYATFFNNLFNAQSIYFLPLQAMTYFMNLRAKYGSSYAQGALAATLLPSLLGGEALTGASVEGSLLDSTLIREANTMLENGQTLSEDQQLRVEAAAKRLQDRHYNINGNLSKVGPLGEADPTTLEEAVSQSTREKAARVSGIVTKPVGFIASLARRLGTDQSKLTMNLNWMMAMLSAQSDPHLKKLWDESAGGTVYDASGHVISLGQADAQALGLTKNDLFYSPVSGLTDFYSEFVMTDPVGMAGKIPAKALSYAGFSGRLGSWYGGLGIRSFDDVYRTFNQYQSVRNAYEYQATHSADDISRTFRNTYSRDMINALGDARSVEEVLLIHAQMGDAFGLLKQEAPTLSMYSLLKTQLRGGIGKQFDNIAGLLGADVDVIQHFAKIVAGEIKMDVKIDSASYAGVNRADVRWRSMWRHWIHDQFSANPMWFDELTGKLETMKIRPGDNNAIPAIMDMATAAKMPPQVVKAMGDLLLKTKNADEFTNAYRQCLYHMVMRRAVSGLDRTQFDVLAKDVEETVWNKIVEISSADGGGNIDRTYPAGELSRDISRVSDEPGGEAVGSFANKESQLGALRLPRAKELQGIANRLREVLLSTSQNTMDLREALANYNTIRMLGKYSNVTLSNVLEKLANVSQMRLIHADMRYPHFNGEGTKGYTNALKEISDLVKQAEKAKELGNEEKFVRVYEEIRSRLTTAIVTLKTHETNVAMESIISWPVGELPAQEALDIFGPRAVHPNVTYAGGTGDVPIDVFKSMSAIVDPKVIDRLRGEAYAYHDMVLALNSSLHNTSTVDYRYIKEYADNIAKERSTVKSEQKRISEEIQNKFNKIDSTRRGYRSRFQYTVDGMNLGLSALFVPLALLSTGWAVRVGMSEAMLNIARENGFNFFDAKIMKAIAKHEMHGREAMTIEGRSEHTLIRDIVAGAILGLERNLLSGIGDAEKERMLDHFVGSIMRHDSHLPGGVEHGQKDIIDPEGVQRTLTQDVFHLDENGEPIMQRGQQAGDYKPGGGRVTDAGYMNGLNQTLSRQHKDGLMLPLHKHIDEELRAAGMRSFLSNREDYINRAIAATEDYFKEGAGKKQWDQANEFIDSQIEALRSNMEFTALTKERQQLFLNAINALRPNAEDITFEALKPYMQKAWSSYQRQIDRTQAFIEKLEKSIASDQAYIENYTKESLTRVADTTSPISKRVEEARLRLVEAEKALKEARDLENASPYAAKVKGRFTEEFKAEQEEMKKARVEIDAAREQLILNIEREVENNHAEIDRRFGGTVHVPDGRIYDPTIRKYRVVQGDNPYHPIVSGNDFLIVGPHGRRYFSRKDFGPKGEIIARSWDAEGELRNVVGGEEASHLAEAHYGLVKRQEALQNFLRDLKSNKAISTDLEHLNIGRDGDTIRGATDSQFAITNGIPIEHILRGDKTRDQQVLDYLEFKRGKNVGSDVLRRGNVDPGEEAVRAFESEEEFIRHYNHIIEQYYNGTESQRENAIDWMNHFDPEQNWMDEEKMSRLMSGETTDPNIFKSGSEVFQMEREKELAYQKDNEIRRAYYDAIENRARANAAAIEARKEYSDLSKRVDEMPTAVQVKGQLKVDTKIESIRTRIEEQQQKLSKAHEDLRSHFEQQDEIKRNSARISNERITRVTRGQVKAEQRYIEKLSREERALYRKMKTRIAKRTSLYNKVFADSLDKLVTESGENAFKNRKDYEALWDRLTPTALEAISKLPADVRSRFGREGKYIANGDYTTGNADEDWAKLNAYDALSTVSGRPADKPDGWKIHSYLNNQAVTGNVEHASQIGRYATKNKETMPVGIQYREFHVMNALKRAADKDLIVRVSDKAHNNYLGKIVNSISRSSEFLLAQHLEMEKLQPLVDSGIIDEMQQETIADIRATQSMSKYFHNPSDKLNFEHNMRVLAPFYFAKNQAWRRAFRLLGEDPGAFEKYMKMNLAVTDYVATNSQNGSIPSILVPGSEFVGKIAGSNALGLLGGGGFGGLGFGLAMSPGSIDSVILTGSQTGWGMLGEIARPAWGPYVTIALREIRNHFFKMDPTAQKYINAAIGPISANSNWISDLFPSGVGRSAVETLLSLTNLNNGPLYSTQNYVLNNNIDLLLQQEYAKVAKDLLTVSSTRTAAQVQAFQSSSKSYQEWYIFHTAENNLQAKFTDPNFKQHFIDTSHAEAVFMFAIKTAISAGFPAAISLQEQFSKAPELDKLLSEVNPDGTKKYTLDQAYQEFAKLYPENQFDLTAHTSSKYSKYPETVSMAQILTDFPNLVAEAPYATAYFGLAGSKYSSAATQLEMSMDLRTREAPQDYLNSVLVAMGNDYYYNAMQPAIMYRDPSNPSAGINPMYAKYDNQGNPTLNYNGIKKIQAEAKSFGDAVNPVWYDDFAGAGKMNIALQSYNQMAKLLSDPNKKLPLSDLDRKRFEAVMGYYNDYATQISHYYQVGDTTQAKFLANQWYGWCTSTVNNPLWTNQTLFITSVLRRLPTVSKQ